ncbi:rCG20017, isoform CRA_a [Rattus norvegicus]|uniref:RCG20017, isoform CRA_a n=1 Tax=Rattus norvegicus TaxID=10116 RepID=A6KIG6_RAT|nr:rCG20017, isoform CRA_a [Rattus norvegicus]EDL87821.1 rCG20017, isoform CRA_a [Rattus norvegicus]
MKISCFLKEVKKRVKASAWRQGPDPQLRPVCCCVQVPLGGYPFLVPSGFTHSLLSSFLSSYQPCRPRETLQGRQEHSVLSDRTQ